MNSITSNHSAPNSKFDLILFLKNLPPVEISRKHKRHNAHEFFPIPVRRQDALYYSGCSLTTFCKFEKSSFFSVILILAKQFSPPDSLTLGVFSLSILRFVFVLQTSTINNLQFFFAFDAKLDVVDVGESGPFTTILSNQTENIIAVYSKTNLCYIIPIPETPLQPNEYISSYRLLISECFSKNSAVERLSIVDVQWHGSSYISILINNGYFLIYNILCNETFTNNLISDKVDKTLNQSFFPSFIIPVPNFCLKIIVPFSLESKLLKNSSTLKFLSLHENGDSFGIVAIQSLPNENQLETVSSISKIENKMKNLTSIDNDVKPKAFVSTVPTHESILTSHKIEFADSTDLKTAFQYNSKTNPKNLPYQYNSAFYKIERPTTLDWSGTNKTIKSYQIIQYQPYFVFCQLTSDYQMQILSFDHSAYLFLEDELHINYSYHIQIFLLDQISLPLSPGSSPTCKPIFYKTLDVPALYVVTPETIIHVEFPWLRQLDDLNQSNISVHSCFYAPTSTQMVFSLASIENADEASIIGSSVCITEHEAKYFILESSFLSIAENNTKLYRFENSIYSEAWDVAYLWCCRFVVQKLCQKKHIDQYEKAVERLLKLRTESTNSNTSRVENQLTQFGKLFEDLSLSTVETLGEGLLFEKAKTLQTQEYILESLDIADLKIQKLLNMKSSLSCLHQEFQRLESFEISKHVDSTQIAITDMMIKLKFHLDKTERYNQTLIDMINGLFKQYWNKVICSWKSFIENKIFVYFILIYTTFPKSIIKHIQTDLLFYYIYKQYYFEIASKTTTTDEEEETINSFFSSQFEELFVLLKNAYDSYLSSTQYMEHLVTL